jgi:tetratricopeptide (TPR) repeat protein
MKLGQSELHLDRYPAALTAFERALALDDNLSNAWHGKGLALFELERYEEALARL